MNPETMAKLALLADEWRVAADAAAVVRHQLDDEIIKAKLAGHSFGQIREATGLGTRTIQFILSKQGLTGSPYRD